MCGLHQRREAFSQQTLRKWIGTHFLWTPRTPQQTLTVNQCKNKGSHFSFKSKYCSPPVQTQGFPSPPPGCSQCHRWWWWCYWVVKWTTSAKEISEVCPCSRYMLAVSYLAIMEGYKAGMVLQLVDYFHEQPRFQDIWSQNANLWMLKALRSENLDNSVINGF